MKLSNLLLYKVNFIINYVRTISILVNYLTFEYINKNLH